MKLNDTFLIISQLTLCGEFTILDVVCEKIDFAYF
jgi:hypothetical protein